MKWFVLVHTSFASTPTKNDIAKPEAMGKNKKQREKVHCRL